MSSEEFMALVAQMRRAQRDYQKSRDYVMLKQAHRLEGEVDLEVSRSEHAKSNG